MPARCKAQFGIRVRLRGFQKGAQMGGVYAKGLVVVGEGTEQVAAFGEQAALYQGFQPFFGGVCGAHGVCSK